MIARDKAARDDADFISNQLDGQDWRGKGKRTDKTFQPRLNAQLFPEFPLQALSGTLSGLELSAREFPSLGKAVAGPTLGDQDFSALLDHGCRDDLHLYRYSLLTAIYQAWEKLFLLGGRDLC